MDDTKDVTMDDVKNDTRILIYKEGEPVWITAAELRSMLEELKNG